MPSTNRITIVVDAMGGDQAPQAIVAGALNAARALPGVDIILTGDQAVVAPLLPSSAPANLRVHHTSQAVDMCESPGVAIRQKPDSSIAVGMKLVRDGKAHGIVSAGNSGAMMAGAMLILKPRRGIDRPAIATPLPNRNGSRAFLLDAGATTDCKAMHLVQFAQLGSEYAASLGVHNPRVGLLSIGEEPSKGNELIKETHQLLLNSDVNFIGNVEPKECTRGEVDVAVCDGFVGNLVLKCAEGFGELINTLLKEAVMSSWLTRLGGLLVRPAMRNVKKVTDYAEYGGAVLLGVNGIVIIGHGRSNERAIENAIRVAVQSAEHRVGVPDEPARVAP
jgi:glycerol-3-phosphate acyltransferase PlsX